MQRILEKEKIWNEHFAACGNSGVSQRTYCKNNNLPLTTFAYWKRKLKNQNNGGNQCLVEVTQGRPSNPQRYIETAGQKGEESIVIRLVNGIEIVVYTSTSADFILRVIEVLENSR